MGEWRPKKAHAYESECYDEMRDTLSMVIQRRLQTDKTAAATVQANMKSCRPANLRDFLDGDGSAYGMVRLTQTAEALGYRPYIAFRKHGHVQKSKTPRHPEEPHVFKKIRRFADAVFTADVCVSDGDEPGERGRDVHDLHVGDAGVRGRVHGRGGLGFADDDQSRDVQFRTEEQAA